MTISAKYRRQIQVDSITYLWWVVEDIEDDFVGTPALSVCSSDKRLLVRYGLLQPEESRYVIVLGPRFQGLPDSPGPWRRFRCPQFGSPMTVSPKDVAALIRWCTDASGSAVAVDYRGIPVPDNLAPRSPYLD
jgi:hypothetical protein